MADRTPTPVSLSRNARAYVRDLMDELDAKDDLVAVLTDMVNSQQVAARLSGTPLPVELPQGVMVTDQLRDYADQLRRLNLRSLQGARATDPSLPAPQPQQESQQERHAAD